MLDFPLYLMEKGPSVLYIEGCIKCLCVFGGKGSVVPILPLACHVRLGGSDVVIPFYHPDSDLLLASDGIEPSWLSCVPATICRPESPLLLLVLQHLRGIAHIMTEHWLQI